MQDTTSFPDEFDAQVWLTDMAIRLGNQVADPQEKSPDSQTRSPGSHSRKPAAGNGAGRHRYRERIRRLCRIVAGAQGLMQVMPFWLDEIGQPGDRLIEIGTNLRMGCTILKYYFDMESGDS